MINIIIRTVCHQQSQGSGGEIGRVQETFLLNTEGRSFESCLKCYFLYIIIYIFFIVYYLIYDHLLTNAFPNTNIGFCRCIYVNKTQLR